MTIAIKTSNRTNRYYDIDKRSQTAADFIIKSLVEKKIDTIFLVPGKTVSPLMEALSKTTEIRTIVAAHECGAGYMADGYARASHNFGVCMIIAGPGTMNAAAAMAAAFSDEVPILMLSGSIASTEEAQGAFQDASASGVNDVALMANVTHYSTSIKNTQHLHHHLNKAFALTSAVEGKTAYLQVPRDIQLQSCTMAQDVLSNETYQPRYIDKQRLNDVLPKMLGRATKIVLLVGKHFNNAKSGARLLQIAERLQIPVATCLDAKGAIPENHPLSLGVFGFAGNTHANSLINSNELDCLITLDYSYNQRNTLCWSNKINPKNGILQIDTHLSRLNEASEKCTPVQSDPSLFLQYLMDSITASHTNLFDNFTARKKWCKTLTHEKKHSPVQASQFEDELINPASAIQILNKVLPSNTNIVVDSGAHRVFMGHYFCAKEPGRYFTSATQAPMGWAIAAAVGIKQADLKSPCAVVTGDGCMLMHGNEIQTAARYEIPLIYIVLNNSAHGGIHMSRKQDNFDQELSLLPQHRWADFAESLGALGFTVTNIDQLKQTVKEALSTSKTCVIDVMCQSDTPVPNQDYLQAAKQYHQRSMINE